MNRNQNVKYISIVSQILLLTNLFKVLGELLFQIRFATNKIYEMQNKEVNLQVFGKTAKNLESINVSKKPLAKLSCLQRL